MDPRVTMRDGTFIDHYHSHYHEVSTLRLNAARGTIWETTRWMLREARRAVY